MPGAGAPSGRLRKMARWASCQGRTWGKRKLKLRVVRAGGR
jgi:hypothetical protein